jgi:hypothetical protein
LRADLREFGFLQQIAFLGVAGEIKDRPFKGIALGCVIEAINARSAGTNTSCWRGNLLSYAGTDSF